VYGAGSKSPRNDHGYRETQRDSFFREPILIA
jgi:hypothetical protein